jgi:hypothetical protein
MTPQQVILKHLQRLQPKINEAFAALEAVEQLIDLADALENVTPLDSLLEGEYQIFTDQTKKAEWVAERLAALTKELDK